MRSSRAVSETVERAGRRERRIFAERMAGDERGIALEVEAGFAFEHAHGGERDRHQGRLRVLGQREPVGRAVPHDGGELLAQRFIDFGEHIAGGGKIVRQAPCPCRPPGCPGREKRMQRTCFDPGKCAGLRHLWSPACQGGEKVPAAGTFGQPLVRYWPSQRFVHVASGANEHNQRCGYRAFARGSAFQAGAAGEEPRAAARIAAPHAARDCTPTQRWRASCARAR